jgi:hypothetical protein
MKKDILNETFNKHTFLLKKRLYEQGVIQQQPIQEVELEEGLKDIALASLIGLSTLFGDAKAKAATASPTNQPTVTINVQLSHVKSAKQKAEGVATEIAQIMVRQNEADVKIPHSRAHAKRMLDSIIKFNKENKLGSKAQMEYAIEYARSGGAPTKIYIGSDEKGSGMAEDSIARIPILGKQLTMSENYKELEGKIITVCQELAESSKDVLSKQHYISNPDLLGAIYGHCDTAAYGDFMQMVAEKMVQISYY